MAETRIGGWVHVPAVYTETMARQIWLGVVRHADKFQLQLGIYQHVELQTHAGLATNSTHSFDNSVILHFDLLTSGLMHAESLPWTTSLPTSAVIAQAALSTQTQVTDATDFPTHAAVIAAANVALTCKQAKWRCHIITSNVRNGHCSGEYCFTITSSAQYCITTCVLYCT